MVRTNLFYIGPVVVDLQNPNATFGPAARGQRTISLTGETDRGPAEQLSELLANDDIRITVGDLYGAVLPVYIDHDDFGAYAGWYLFPPAEHTADWVSELSGLHPVKLNGVFLGHAPEIVIDRTSVPKSNDFVTTAMSMVVSPFRPESDAGDRFIVDPGGAFAVRQYDPTDYDPAVPTPDEVASIGYYTGIVTETTDELAPVCLPRVAWSKEVPRWLTQQGGMVRGYDRRAERSVFGPHPFLETTDLMVNNGLLQAKVGNRGLRPYFDIRAFADSWREPGTIQFGAAIDELVDARLVRLTFDDVTLALTVKNHGDVLVTLKRGEQQLHVSQPTTMGRPVWSGVPPASRAVRARVTTARFVKGLAGGSDVEDSSWEAPFTTWAGDDEHDWDGTPYAPDLRLRWPPAVLPDDWACAWRYQPLRPLDELGTVGLRTLYDADGIAHVECYVDGADSKAKVRVSDTVVIQSAALDFDAADDILIRLSYDGTTLTLSWRADDGTITHTSAAATITADAFFDDTFFVNFDRWGTEPATWGPDAGLWGGQTYFPGGAIDNDMVFERAITNSEFVTLATADTPLEGLPSPEGALRRYVPFDAEPLVSMPSIDSTGRSADPLTDDSGFIKTVAALTNELDEWVAFLARETGPDIAANQHAQAATENTQRIRAR